MVRAFASSGGGARANPSSGLWFSAPAPAVAAQPVHPNSCAAGIPRPAAQGHRAGSLQTHGAAGPSRRAFMTHRRLCTASSDLRDEMCIAQCPLAALFAFGGGEGGNIKIKNQKSKNQELMQCISSTYATDRVTEALMTLYNPLIKTEYWDRAGGGGNIGYTGKGLWRSATLCNSPQFSAIYCNFSAIASGLSILRVPFWREGGLFGLE